MSSGFHHAFVATRRFRAVPQPRHSSHYENHVGPSGPAVVRSWRNMGHWFRIANYVAIVAAAIMYLLVDTSIKAQQDARDRVYGHDGNARRVFVVADRGYSAKYAPNTLAAFTAALNYTRHIKTDVMRTVDGAYVIQTRNSLFYDTLGIVSDRRCDRSLSQLNESYVEAGQQLLTLNDTLAFASANNVTLMIEFFTCVGQGSALSDADAAVEIHTLATTHYGLAPSQFWFTYSEREVALALLDVRNVSLSTLFWNQPSMRTLFQPWKPGDALRPEQRPWNESVGVDTGLRVQAGYVDPWPPSYSQGIGRDTWLHVYNLPRPDYMRKFLKYSAARSIETSDPALIHAIAAREGISVLE